MPRGRTTDIFASLRAQTGKALAQLEAHIAQASADLERMVEQAESWRAILGSKRGPGRPPGSGRGPGRPPGPKRGPGRPKGSSRVSWDQVLASVPKKFGVEDVLKHPGAAAKGRPQIYPELNRWEATKRIRRVSTGIYEKLGGKKVVPAKKK